MGPQRSTPVSFRLAGLLLLILGLLPIANWIPGGHAEHSYADHLAEWLSGGAIVLGIGVVGAMSFNRYPALWREGLWASLARRWQAKGVVADLAIAAIVVVLCAVVAQTVFSAKPLLIDEIIETYQARIFASGRLWLPAPVHPEFTSAMHLIDWGGKVYGQFPAGGPAFLAIGTLLHAEWLVGPVCSGGSVFLFARLLRRIEPRPGTALAALLLFSAAPFVVFMGGSYMNHVPTLMCLLAAALALAVATSEHAARPGAAFWCGLALGIAATIRPTDGAAFALPAGAWLLWRARQGNRHITALLASGVGIAIPLVALLYVNAAQTGDPFRFGYIEMWGKTHALGFHESPWGPPHTPARGIELINLYLLRLQTWLFEGPGPSLLFATAALLLVRRPTAFDRWSLAGSGALLLAYFAYWHDGFYLGPRFILPLVPWLLLWTARVPAILTERQVSIPVVRGTVLAGVAALGIGMTGVLGGGGVPLRAVQYHNGMLSMRFDVDALAESHGVRDALVIVRESWGAQLVTRLWALGVSRTLADQLYRTTDACVLEKVITSVEDEGGKSTTFLARIAPYRADSARLVSVQASPDTSLRMMPGNQFSSTCLRRLDEDRAGYTLFPPILLAKGGNSYVLDLHARDTLMLAAHPGRAVWLLTKPVQIGADLMFTPVSLDSARAEWQTTKSGGN